MKITNEESVRAGIVERANPPVAVGKTQTHHSPYTSPAVHIDLSEQAQALSASKSASKTEAARYLPAVQAAPETRTDLVSKLKTQVESGSYHVSGTDIADQILRRAQADRLQ